MTVFNLNSDPEWDRTEDREGWRIKDAWVGAHIDAELIGASMYEVEPGDKQGPFHTHHANEEWVIVSCARATWSPSRAARKARTRSATTRTRRSVSSCSRPLSHRTSSSISTPARSARAASPASGSCSASPGLSSTTGRARSSPTRRWTGPPKQGGIEMTRYLISSPSGAMDPTPQEGPPAVGEAAHAVVQEAMDAGVWVFGGGLAEDVDPDMVAGDGTITAGSCPQTKEFNGGFTVLDVPSREAALEWAAKIAAACRCAQEIREFMPDPVVGN